MLKKGDKTNFPKKGDTVHCWYTGKLQDGTVFDTNVQTGEAGRAERWGFAPDTEGKAAGFVQQPWWAWPGSRGTARAVASLPGRPCTRCAQIFHEGRPGGILGLVAVT